MTMRYLLIAALLLTGCVSSKLAKANLESVDALGAVAVEHDPVNEPEASAAVDNAIAIVEATAPLKQITNLGVPTELVDKNTEHVENLSTAVAPIQEQPKVKIAVARARKNAEAISGEVHEQAKWKAAIPTGIPWVDTALQLITLVGGLVGAAYGATRGQKHVRAWWNEPGKKQVERPKSLPGEIASR